MKEKLEIASKPCKFCGGLISWKKKIDGKLPVHCDQQGYIIGDGRCPEFKKPKKKAQVQFSFFETQKFNRFNQERSELTYSLPIFQEKEPLIPRFYIGKIILNLKVYKKIIKIPHVFSQLNIWSLAHTLVRGYLEQKGVISFFKIIDNPDTEERFIHFYIVPNQHHDLTDTDSFIKGIITNFSSNVSFISDLIINKDFIEEIITDQNIEKYIRAIKVFFDALVYRIRYKKDNGEYRVTTHFDIFDKMLYFYVDLDVLFYGKGSQATMEDKGKYILGEARDRNRKYLLMDITSSTVVTHLDTPDYQKFLEFSRNAFENRGYPRKKSDGSDWTLLDYWEKINEVSIPENDLIAIVQDKRETKLFFPLSRLFKNEIEDISKTERANGIQQAKQELYKILEEQKSRLKAYSSLIDILLLDQVVPKYFDLASYPMIIQFADNRTIQIQRDKTNFDKLDQIPQELLKSYSKNYKPIAGQFDFMIIPIIPSDLSPREVSNVDKLVQNIAYNLKAYNLSDNIEISDSITYKFDRNEIYHRKHNIWGAIFDTQISPEIITINKSISSRDIIAIPLIGLRNMGNSSRLFKYYIQNEFYRLLKTDLSKEHFGVIQSFLVDEYKSYKGSKLAVMLYKNTLFNIGVNCSDSEIGHRIRGGILFKFKYPFGTRDISRPIESIEMQAGFDASKVWGVEYSKPRGAVIVTLDPYGKQVRSKYIRDAQTHKGLMSESVIKDLIIEIYKHQTQLVDDELKDDTKFPKKIIFLFDGNINVKQKELFIKVYNELIESGEYPILPEFFIFEVLKTHPLRMYLLKDSKIYDIPFGVMALLNNKEFAIKSHIWTKNSMPQPQLYRFKMRLAQRFKDVERYSVLDIELVNIAVQLFQSTLFNTGKSGRPLKESFVIHESHKLSQEFASKSDSIGILYYKD